MTVDTADRFDRIFRLLSHRDRRRLLYYLREHDSATRTELADVVAGWRATDSEDGVVRASRHSRIVSSLHHQHLPALEDVGLVTVDDDVVRTTDWPNWVDRCLDLTFEVETSDDRRDRLRHSTGGHDGSQH